MIENKEKYGMYKGEWIADMTREELLELILVVGEENWSLRKKPCVHDEISAIAGGKS